jgi:hypothetical protein
MAKATARRPRRAESRKESAREGMRKHREDMRRRGFKLVQLWVPDPSAPGFAAELQRQIRSLATHADREADSFTNAGLAAVWNDPEWKP